MIVLVHSSSHVSEDTKTLLYPRWWASNGRAVCQKLCGFPITQPDFKEKIETCGCGFYFHLYFSGFYLLSFFFFFFFFGIWLRKNSILIMF
jgi:hypothetical protein